MKAKTHKLIKIGIVVFMALFILMIVIIMPSVQNIICHPSYGFAVSLANDDRVEIFADDGEKVKTIYPQTNGAANLVSFDGKVAIHYVREDKTVIYGLDGSRIEQAREHYDINTQSVKSSYTLANGSILRYRNILGFETLTVESESGSVTIYRSTVYFVFKLLLGVVVWIVASRGLIHYYALIFERPAQKTQ